MNYIRMIRVKNWIKNFLIFIPFIFSAKFLDFDKVEYFTMFLGFFIFCFSSSIIYIINDIMDIEKDKLDEKKCHRPIASGCISIKNAIITVIILAIIVVSGLLYLNSFPILGITVIYIVFNILYSFKFKNIPIWDITLLSLFFLIRIFYGGVLLNIPVSIYLYLTTLSAAFYFGITKRKKELENNKNVRKVLQEYPAEYLNNSTTLFLGLTIVYYSLWVINYTGIINRLVLDISIVLVIVILLWYNLIISKNKNGNPTDVLLENKTLIFMVLLYCFVMFIGFFI